MVMGGGGLTWPLGRGVVSLAACGVKRRGGQLRLAPSKFPPGGFGGGGEQLVASPNTSTHPPAPLTPPQFFGNLARQKFLFLAPPPHPPTPAKDFRLV